MLQTIINLPQPNSSNHGVIKELLKNEPNVTINTELRVFVQTKSYYVGNLFDNSQQTFITSGIPNGEPDGTEQYLTVDFKYRRLSLSGVQIFGIFSPYTVAFSMYGSNDGEKWELIKPFPDLGMKLYASRVFFPIEPYTKFYRYIKYVNELGMNFNTKDENHRTFGMYEYELYGVLAPKSYLYLFTCKKSNFRIRIHTFVIVLFLWK